MIKLTQSFYARNTLTVAKELLGKYLVHELNGKKFVGRIVEAEAYIGEEDKACHGRFGRTKRNEILFGKPGHAYVYMIYGMYYMMNVVTEKADFPSAVLIRAVEPVASSAVASSKGKTGPSFRHSCEGGNPEKPKTRDQRLATLRKLGSGPGVLTRWMEISRLQNGIDIVNSDELYISSTANSAFNQSVIPAKAGILRSLVKPGITKKKIEIVETTRIGVEYAGECALKPWRFYIKDNPFVSRR